MIGMKLGRKGQIFGGGMMFMIFGIVMIFFFMMYMMQFGGMLDFMRDYDDYPNAWREYVDKAFMQEEDRGWRALTLFGLPFLLYFSVIQLSLTFVFSGAAARFGYFRFENIQRPLMVVCLTVAFLMLPGPMTYMLSGMFMMLSPIVAIAIAVLAMMGLFLVWTFVNQQMGGLGIPGVPAPPAAPPLAAAPPGAVAVPPAARHHFNLAAHHLGMLAAHLQNAINNLP